MTYRAHRGFVEPARRAPQVWRLALGLMLTAAVTIGLGQAIFALASALLPPARAWEFIAEAETGRRPLGALVFLVSVGALGMGAALAAKLLHRRRARTLFGPLVLAVPQFLRVAAAVGVLYAVLTPFTPTGGALGPGLALGAWLGLLPLSLTALLIQTGGEEMVFRGYLQQQLAARFDVPALWMGLPSALFALGHYAPGLYGANAGWVALWAFLFGMVAADLTARAGTLGPALALHLVNNAFALLVIAPQGDLSGLALYRLPFGPEDEAAIAALLPAEFATLGVGWLAARLALRR